MTAHSVLNATHPIQKIAVSSGEIVRPTPSSWLSSVNPRPLNQVDGLTVTYQLEGGKTTAMSHGSVFNPPSSVVSFGGERQRRHRAASEIGV